jgi:hypothetical protein
MVLPKSLSVGGGEDLRHGDVGLRQKETLLPQIVGGERRFVSFYATFCWGRSLIAGERRVRSQVTK